MDPPLTLGIVDDQPALWYHPPLRVPPGLLAPNGDTVVTVQAVLDTSGHVVPGSAAIFLSANRVFDSLALQAVVGSVYLPARRRGRAIPATIRQPVTFRGK